MQSHKMTRSRAGAGGIFTDGETMARVRAPVADLI